MRLSETIQKIIDLVKEYEDKGGITKNEACRILMKDHGGSRSTYWKGFDHLLGEKGGNLVEARLVPPSKQQKKLFPTESSNRLTEFKKKLELIKDLIDLIDNNPSVGDCYFNDIKTKKITKFSKKFVPHFQREADKIMKHNEEKLFDAYTLQARHNLLEKMPLFLYDYVQDPDNGLIKIKDECLKICNSIIERCLNILQRDYSNSPFFSNSWAHKSKSNLHVWDARGQIIPGVESEFLKILGRYYFLISKQFTKNFKVKTCNEQQIISNFTNAFYPRKKIMRSFDPKNKVILESNLYDYKWKTLADLNKVEFFPVPLPDDVIEIYGSLGGKLMHSFYDDDFNDPAGVAEYYLNWFIGLKVFSSVELGIITIIFIRAIVQKQIEKDMDTDTSKRFANSMAF